MLEKAHFICRLVRSYHIYAFALLLNLAFSGACLGAPLTCNSQGYATIIGTEVAATHCIPKDKMDDDTIIKYQYRDFECVNGVVTLKSVGNTVELTPNQIMHPTGGISYRMFRNEQGSYFFIVPDAYKGLVDGKQMTKFLVGNVYTNIFTEILEPKMAAPNCKGDPANHSSMQQCSMSTINRSTGRLSHSQELFNVKNSQPLSLNATLYYRSISYQSSAIGTGWSLNYETYLQDNGSKGITFWEEGNSRIYRISGGVYQPPRGDYSTLVKNTDGSYLITEKDGIQKTFNSSGAITAIQDRNNNTLTFTYTAAKLTSITDPSGRSMTLAYDANNKLSSITDPRGKVFTLSYTNGLLAAVIHPDATQWTYRYDGNGLMVNKTMPGGETVSYQYNTDQQVQSVQDPKKQDYAISYNGGGAPEDGFVPDCYHYYFEYETYGALYSPTFTYTAKNGGIWSYTYDPYLGVVNSITDPLGNTTAYSYDTQLNLLKETEPGNAGTTNTTSYTYDSKGNPLSVTNPLGQITNLTYNEFGQILTVSGTPGNYSLDYDTTGNLKTITDPGGAITQYSYDPKGNLTSVINAKKQTTTIGYDSSNNLTSITRPGNIVTLFSYDPNGNLLTLTDAASNIYRLSYDAMNRLSGITDPLGNLTTYSYDSNGNPGTVTDANGRSTSYSFSHDGKLTQIKDALNSITALNYGTSGSCPACSGVDQLSAIIDAKNQSTTYTHDMLGRKLSETDPLGKTTSYIYDKIRKPASRTDANKITITYTYDALKRLTKKSYPDSSSVTYSHDNRSNLLTAANKDISYNFTYNAAGKLSNLTDSRGFTLDYEYDILGTRTKTTLQKGTADEHTTSYTYDEANRPNTITSNSGTFTYGYDAIGRRNSTTYPNGITTTYTYDTLSRLTGISHANGATPIAFANYTDFDNIGNRKNKTTATGSEQYSYDEIYRLTKTATPKGAEAYSYDPVGNRLTGPGPKDNKYQYNAANQQIIGKIYSHDYDNNGNQITRITPNATDKSWTHSWDNENRLIKSEQTKGTEKRTVTFSYDPFGRRIQKQLTTIIKGITKTTTWQYLYDNDNIALEILTKPDTTTEKTWYTHGAGTDEHLALERNNTNYFYHADGLGSITTITDSNKAIVQSYQYDSFGMVRPKTGFRNSFIYTGREFDPETWMYYYRARYYDPMDGRFVSRDPISFAGGDVNLYGYTKNNSINYTDPFGLTPPNVIYPGANIAANIEEARRMNIFDFLNAVKAGGKWDYKQYGIGNEYEDFGNYHFGIVANAFGFNKEFTLRGAGAYQHLTDLKRALKGKKRIGKGCFIGGAPYGDDQNDQKWITEGYFDYDNYLD